MGRKTFQSIGSPLPGRTNIVVTTAIDPIPGVITVKNPQAARSIASLQESPVFVIGGRQLFESLIDDIDVIYRTVIAGNFEADVTLDMERLLAGFELSEKTALFPSDNSNEFPYHFEIWRRKN